MRYLKLAKAYLKINLKSLAVYDLDFYFGIFGMMIQNVLNLVALSFLFNIVPQIKGFTYDDLLLTYSLSTFSFSIFRCFFINTLNLAEFINKGNLDTILVKPINPLFQLINQRADEDAWGDLLVSFVLLITVSLKLHYAWYIILMLIFISFFTSLIFMSIALLGNVVSLFSNGLSDLAEITFDLFELSKYPLAIYSAPLKIILTFILPVGWVASFPLERVATYHEMYWVLIIPLISIVYFVIIYKLWNIFINNYQSTGS
ncbi:ABC transporter permease [Lactobacillus mulieris]|uniref:ABC-2 family transporter protein n=1 Tax=Lactobacillus mulieris TaxID=2508708 RepID=A0AAW5WWF9_9LACO|nr:ABC-2 family transporter protein [Lactobacillus mulieris]MCZ3621966.1 ABC-2 family transporter protein [Lactobacillus mulieris]MCZ3623663.1 ABC-2 family transporter protein [Lactobacillus mulieris]MCZ3635973.1 ABC-2 family transporter protein [Lactobacillus mulieris]MCZ3689703.1 ABC-2 family transporter protein [Lactobacillus mulieris]MCZ3695706.1 ABC-2 family transporter protein [Lactobacillus mulieris]